MQEISCNLCSTYITVTDGIYTENGSRTPRLLERTFGKRLQKACKSLAKRKEMERQTCDTRHATTGHHADPHDLWSQHVVHVTQNDDILLTKSDHDHQAGYLQRL